MISSERVANFGDLASCLAKGCRHAAGNDSRDRYFWHPNLSHGDVVVQRTLHGEGGGLHGVLFGEAREPECWEFKTLVGTYRANLETKANRRRGTRSTVAKRPNPRRWPQGHMSFEVIVQQRAHRLCDWPGSCNARFGNKWIESAACPFERN